MISKSSKDRILKRLKQENARSPYLNSLPGKFKSYSKLDLGYLPAFNSTTSKKIIPAIIEAGSFSFQYSASSSAKSASEDMILQKVISTIVDRAKVISQETGSESLAIGYPMLLEKSAGSTTDCKVIPLFIWPVEVRPDRISTRWKFTLTSELPRINPSLKGFIESEKIPLDLKPLYQKLESEELDEMSLDVFKALLNEFQTTNSSHLKRAVEDISALELIPYESKTEMREAANAGIEFEVVNSALLTTYRESKFSIIKDFELLGDSIPDIGKAKAKVLDIPANPLDPSQFGTLEDINSLNHVVLHGPPGTGKSQTITGVITAGLANKLKIAVVCQKAAAIDVLIENLAELGIENETIRITNVSADRKSVVEKVRKLENLPQPAGLAGLKKQTLQDFDKLSSEVIDAYLAAQDKILWEGYTWNKCVGSISKYRREHPELEGLEYPDQGKIWHSSPDVYRELAGKLDELYPELNEVQDILGFLNVDAVVDDVFIEIEEIRKRLGLLQEITERKLTELLDDIRVLQVEENNRLREIKKQALDAMQGLINIQNVADPIVTNKKFLESFSVIPHQLAELSEATSKLEDLQNGISDLSDDFTSFTASKAFQKFGNTSGFKSFIYSFSKAYKEFKSDYNALKLRAIGFQVMPDNNSLEDANVQIGTLLTQYNAASEYVSQFPDGAAQKLQQIKDQISLLSKDLDSKDHFIYPLNNEQLDTYLSLLEARLGAIEFLCSTERLISLDCAKDAVADPKLGISIMDRIELKGLRLDGAFEVFKAYTRFKGLLPLENRTCSFITEFQFGVLSFITKEHYAKYETSLPRVRFTAKFEKQEQLLKAISDESRRVAKYQSGLRRSNAFNQIESKAYSVAKVFALRGKGKKSLRQIAQQYPDELTELFPVFMMTPEVACNLFEGSKGLFDILIVDEASQVELHDILPVLFKGKTLVVAGDQHQMPPSNFFSAQLELDEEEDEDDLEALIEVESLLEFCQTHKKFKSRYLDFHYRSNHEALINFSNDAIYKRLVVKPTREWKYAPYYFSRVYNGKWINNKNKPEAERVVKHLKDLEISGHTPRILVATLNALHRKEVQDHIVAATIEDPAFETKMNELERHGFGVKNLENLQGDECDLLIITTGYGPGQDGRFRQNLGVLNQEKGYRLLNVLITRAKYKVILITSIPKQAYKDYLDTLKAGKFGRGLLYAYIAYVEAFTEKDQQSLRNLRHLLREHGIQTVSQDAGQGTDELESPFEAEVYEFLLKHFNPNEIVLQEQHSSGFRIDMVLRPKGKDGLRIAIECDGATFHSGWKNQTLDIHRQRLLEQAGYHFIRIWSTDWWRSQKATEKMVLEQIQAKIKERRTAAGSEHSWLQLQWEEDLEELHEDAHTYEVVEESQSDIPQTPVVSDDCYVTLEVLNKKMEPVSFWIISNQGRKKEGFKCVPNTERLPQALMGKSVDEQIIFNGIHYRLADLHFE